MEKLQNVEGELKTLEQNLARVSYLGRSNSPDENEEADALDVFMKNLKSDVPDLIEIKHLKVFVVSLNNVLLLKLIIYYFKCAFQSQIIKLKIEEEKLKKLIKIAKPTHMPDLKVFPREPEPLTEDVEIDNITDDKKEVHVPNNTNIVQEKELTKSNERSIGILIVVIKFKCI